jgi:hypothetical protein
MAKQPTPQGISALLKNAGFKRSVTSKSRIRGMSEHSAGYEIHKHGSETVEVLYQPGVNRNAAWTEEKLVAFTEAIEAGGFSVQRGREGIVSSLIVSANEEA